MSRVVGALLALCAILGPRPAMAQDRRALAAEVARLTHRVDSLHARWGEASLVWAAGSVGVPPAELHPELALTQVEGLRIRTNRSPLPVEAGAREAWALLEGYFGTELAHFTFRTVTIEGIDPDSTHGELGDIADISMSWDRPAHELALYLVRSVVLPADDSALIGWLHGVPSPDVTVLPALAAVHTQMILSPFSSGRDCLVGDLAACRGALQLLPEEGWGEAAFPLPSDRVALARSLARGNVGAPQRAVLGQCLSAGDAESCSELMGSMEPRALPLVADGDTRRTLLAVALRHGGPEGYHRLRASAGLPMGERLAAAAGLPVDTLLGEWLNEIEGATRATTPWSARMGFSGIAWVGLLLLASLWSSRWRAE